MSTRERAHLFCVCEYVKGASGVFHLSFYLRNVYGVCVQKLGVYKQVRDHGSSKRPRHHATIVSNRGISLRRSGRLNEKQTRDRGRTVFPNFLSGGKFYYILTVHRMLFMIYETMEGEKIFPEFSVRWEGLL